MAVVVFLLLCAIAWPLLLVWKQSYINNVSLKLEYMADTVATVNGQVASLKLECERLSANARIERIARENLGLEYPSSKQIVIVEVERRKTPILYSPAEWLDQIRRAVRGG